MAFEIRDTFKFSKKQLLVSVMFSLVFFCFTSFSLYLCYLLSSAYIGFSLLLLYWFLKVEPEITDLRPFFTPKYLFSCIPQFWYVCFHFHSVEKNFLVFLLISSLTHGLFKSLLLSKHLGTSQVSICY
jgi:hypothetical protein